LVEKNSVVLRSGKFGIATYSPQEVLDVNGNAVIRGSIQGNEIKIVDNYITTTSTNANLELRASGSGTVQLDVPTQSTVGSAGAASALPASPDIYFKININGIDYVVPGFAVV
jgi:hypothetical protein